MATLQRRSLPDQVAAFLREGITTARWTRELPSEAALGRELRVSRVTLRRGLDQLAREGWIAPGGRGRHHRIRQRASQSVARTGHVVRVLCPFSFAALNIAYHVTMETVTEHLGASGYRLEYMNRPAVFTRHSADELGRLVALPDTAAWILLYAPASMQRWFAENRVPCVVAGRLAEGVALPSVFPDGPAMGRHAAGHFCRRGHRELVYLIAELTSLGDRACAEVFSAEARELGARVRIITHPREAAGLVQALDACFAARPRPTAVFSTCPEHCLTTLCYLREKGLHVPTDVSLLAGLEDEMLHFTLPRFAYYRTDGAGMGRKTAKILADLIRQGSVRAQSHRFLPKFVAGDTLGRAVNASRSNASPSGGRNPTPP